MRTIDWSASKKKYIENKNTKEDGKDENITYSISNNIQKTSSIPKYPILMILFVIGIVSVSIIKNETRSLQKEINKLQTSIKLLKNNLIEEKLDYETITSPENISLLAREFLDEDFLPYKKKQIKNLNDKIILNKNTKKITKNLKNKSKIKKKIIIAKEKVINDKKVAFQKIKEIYSEPEKLPSEVKFKFSNTIENTKASIQNFYSDPKTAIKSPRAQKWAAIQVVKAFFGIPIVPGK